MSTSTEHDDNYFQRTNRGGGADLPANAPVIKGGGASLPAGTPAIFGGAAFTRHMEDSKLAKANGFDFPKGLPTSIKLKLHQLVDEHGITTDTLADKASELATKIQPLLEQGYDFVVNHVEALVEQIKSDAGKYLASKNQK